jgi:hypothetical protein
VEYLGRNTERFKTVQVLNDLTVEKVLFVSNINDTRPTAGQVLTWDGRVITWKDDTNTTYLPATSSVLGLLKIEDDTEQSVAANAVTATASRTYGIQFNSNDQAVVNVPWVDTDTTYSMMTDSVLGLGKLEDNTTQTTAANTVTTTALRTYGIQKNSSNQLVVNVPWTDTAYTLPLATTSVRGGVELGSDTDLTQSYETGGTGTASRTYPVQLNSADQMGVSVPWTDTTYTLPQATATARGGVELFSNTVQVAPGAAVSATAFRTYGVQLNSADQMVVNVPWTDTDTKVTLNGTTANGVATYGGVDTLDIESTLTYNSNVLTIGSTTSSPVTVTTPVNAPGQPGDRLYFQCGESGTGTNIAGGQQFFWSGLGTGDKAAGMYTFLGAPAIQLAGGTLRSRENLLFQIFAYAGAANSSVTVQYDVNDIRNYFATEVKANGQTNLTTVDNASHNADLAITADGAVDIISTDASNDITLNSAGEIELNADGGNVDFKNNTAHFAKLENLSNGRGRLELYGGSCGSGNCGSEINLYEDTGAGSNHITLKGAWTSGGLGSDKAINLPNADGTVALTDDSAGGQYWHQIVPGYRQNNTSTTFYYTFYRNWYENWSNGDSSPTSISYTDSFSNFMIAPRAGKITNIKIQGTAADTGATDPFKFYLMKGAMSNGSASVSLTHMFNTSAITPPAVNQTWSHTEDFTSSNTFAEDDMLFIWLKKDSNSGNQDLFFNININGVYTN